VQDFVADDDKGKGHEFSLGRKAT
jgi:hypothetical protein